MATDVTPGVLMRAVSAVAVWAAQGIYAVMKAVLPVRRKAVFLSRQSDSPSRDFRMLVAELETRQPDMEIVVRCRFVTTGLLDRATYIGEVFAQMYHLATASVAVVDTYIIPVSVLTHRPELFVIQTWHALGAIKKFGLQSLNKPSGRSATVAGAMRMHRNYDAVLCGGPGTVPAFAEAFGADPSIVLPLGLPRVDYLLAHASETARTSHVPRIRNLCERFPRLVEGGRTIVLYAPTFRGRHTEAPRPQHTKALHEIIGAFAGDRFTLIVKPHDLETAVLSGPHVVDATGVEALHLLPLCDAVVTDYSAIAFEAAVLDKPVYFFVYDLDDYAREQGLNLDPLAVMPEVSARDAASLAEKIGAGCLGAQTALPFKERYVSAASGDCTAHIATLIIDHIPTVGSPVRV